MMFKCALIPLDGSRLSEVVLPYVERLAHALNLEDVILLSIFHDGDTPQLRAAEEYLQGLADSLKKAWGSARLNVRVVAARHSVGDTASVILRFAEENGADLIMMSTHGRSGFDRWLMGSTTEKVLRGADIPVFLVRSKEDEDVVVVPSLKRIMVPLDGSELAEHALPVAAHVAEATSARVVLLRVKDPSEELTKEDLHAYLSDVVRKLAESGAVAEHRARSGQPAEELLQEVEEGIDLVVMSSHGRTGLARWALGSVADKVLHGSPVPVLLVRSEIKAAAHGVAEGPLVHRCWNCGRRTYRESFSPDDRCGRCHYYLKDCRNCVHYRAEACELGLPYVADVDPGRRCPSFEFRETRVVLR